MLLWTIVWLKMSVRAPMATGPRWFKGRLEFVDGLLWVVGWWEASRRPTQRASCDSHMGKQNKIITREILILAMWCIEQKVIIFRCRTDIRDEPARPWRYLTAHFSNLLKDTSLKLLHNKATGLKIVVSNFYRDFFIISEVLSFFCDDGFLPFLHITQEPLYIFKIWLYHVKVRLKIYLNHYKFHFKNKFYMV